MKIVIVTGGFDPLHSGHISYFNSAKLLGHRLIVGLNSDAWLERKKGRAFMPLKERMSIVANLRVVDDCIQFNDSDNSACDAIHYVKEMYPNAEIIFANGGDRTAENIPEMIFDDVKFVFGVGGENKMNSSSWILQEWKNPKTERQWGYYRVLYETPTVKVKELVVQPGKSLSMQKHFYRNEHWHIAEGVATITQESSHSARKYQLESRKSLEIPVGTWHQLVNEQTTELKIVEIQYGDKCVEEDIERR
jgi:cytidyltransferase-like protein